MTEPDPRQPPVDQRLLDAAREGDPAALDHLLRRHLPGLRAFVRLRTGPAIRARESSSDVVQSVCREVIERAGEFRHGGDAGFKRWLYETARRKLADRGEFHQAAKRDVGREATTPSQLDDAELAACYQTLCTPSRTAELREQVERVEAAFDDLPEPQRDLILRAKLLEESRSDIAKSLGKSEGAVRTMLSRALARLAELLDEGCSAKGKHG